MIDRITLATGNPSKVSELRALLGDRYHIEPRPSELAETVEDGATLEANAIKKAAEVANHTGTIAVADDTGLFVNALDGRPGVRTARYAGPSATDEENVARLLSELADVSVTADRAAHFATVIAVVQPDGQQLVVEGRVTGVIATERRGDTGFGYDPVFVPDEGDGRTFAEMGTDIKNTISHRARAVQALLASLGE